MWECFVPQKIYSVMEQFTRGNLPPIITRFFQFFLFIRTFLGLINCKRQRDNICNTHYSEMCETCKCQKIIKPKNYYANFSGALMLKSLTNLEKYSQVPKYFLKYQKIQMDKKLYKGYTGRLKTARAKFACNRLGSY